MTRRWPLWLTLFALCAGGYLAYDSAVFSSRSGDATPLYSARRHDPYGTAALLTLLNERGVPARTLQRPTLRPEDKGVLIQVLSAQTGRGPNDELHLQTSSLVDWLAQGNTVVQLTRTPTELMEHFGIEPAGPDVVQAGTPRPRKPGEPANVAPRPPGTRHGPAANPATQAVVKPASPVSKELQALETAETRGDPPDTLPGVVYVTDGPARVSLRAPMFLEPRPDDAAWAVLARTPPAGRVVAAEYRVGRGRLVIVGAPTSALNGTIGDGANLDFVLGLAGPGPVLLDEWSHGIGQRATVARFLLDAGLLPLLAQIAFVVGLYVWSTSTKRPDDEDAAPERSRSAADQVATLGHLYARSLGGDAAFDRVRGEVYRRLGVALLCQPGDVDRRLATQPAAVRDRCRALFARLADARPPRDVKCPNCGYDLRAATGDKCPECGTPIPPLLKRRIAAADPADAGGAGVRSARPEAVYVEVLNGSYELAQEIRHERRVRK